MPAFTLDGHQIESPETFWREYVHVVRPEGAEYFGRNLAAFDDALSGGPGWPGEDAILRIADSATAIARLGDDFIRKLENVARDRMKIEWL